MTDEERMLEAGRRYIAAVHGVQSGVAARMEYGDKYTSPKHMRTGIDMSKADQAGLAKLLIAKGVITEVEYHEAMADGAEEERKRYEEYLSKKLRKEIKLG